MLTLIILAVSVIVLAIWLWLALLPELVLGLDSIFREIKQRFSKNKKREGE